MGTSSPAALPLGEDLGRCAMESNMLWQVVSGKHVTVSAINYIHNLMAPCFTFTVWT